MRVGSGLGFLMVACIFVVMAATADEEAYSVTLDAFIERAAGFDIVVLGEIHDNPEHHRIQAQVVAALKPAALVFEMIPQEREARINELRAEGADRGALAEALDWGDSGWPDFAFYAEIMEAAPEAQIFGGEQPSAEVRRAMLEGAAGVFGPDAKIYGLDVQLEPEEQAAREAIQAEAHCGQLSAELLPGMVEAQRFRDAGLADATLWARIMTGDRQVVVIAGSGHADKARGMPAMIAMAEPEAKLVTLGLLEDPVEDPDAFDAVMVAPAPERGDPCAALAAPNE